MGRYGYRVAVYRRRRLIAATAPVFVYSYGLVTAYQLCEANNTTAFKECDQATIQVGSRVFAYASSDSSGNTTPEGNANVVATRTSCRAASINYAVSNDDATDVNTVGAEVTQSAADATSSSTTPNAIGTLNVAITSPEWDLIFWTDTGNGTVFWNGIFSCWTPNGEA